MLKSNEKSTIKVLEWPWTVDRGHEILQIEAISSDRFLVEVVEKKPSKCKEFCCDRPKFDETVLAISSEALDDRKPHVLIGHLHLHEPISTDTVFSGLDLTVDYPVTLTLEKLEYWMALPKTVEEFWKLVGV